MNTAAHDDLLNTRCYDGEPTDRFINTATYYTHTRYCILGGLGAPGAPGV